MRRTRTGDFSVKHGSRITTILAKEVDELRRQLDILFPSSPEKEPDPDPNDDPATSRLEDMDLDEIRQHLVFWDEISGLITHMRMHHGYAPPIGGINQRELAIEHERIHRKVWDDVQGTRPEPSDEEIMALLRSAVRQVDLNPIYAAAEMLTRDAVKRAFEVLRGHTR